MADRWRRTVRDARPGGYVGLIFTHAFGWALVNAVASGLSPLSLWLLGLVFLLRLTVAMTVGAAILGVEGDEVVHLLVDAMASGTPYDRIGRTMHIHPTVSELIPTLMGEFKPLD